MFNITYVRYFNINNITEEAAYCPQGMTVCEDKNNMHSCQTIEDICQIASSCLNSNCSGFTFIHTYIYIYIYIYI